MKPALTLLTALLLAPLVPLHAADAPPPANWDRVPLNIHFGKRSGNLTDAEIDFPREAQRFGRVGKGARCQRTRQHGGGRGGHGAAD